jgi:hypothetical protein
MTRLDTEDGLGRRAAILDFVISCSESEDSADGNFA